MLLAGNTAKNGCEGDQTVTQRERNHGDPDRCCSDDICDDDALCWRGWRVEQQHQRTFTTPAVVHLGQ